ncbi:MAG: glycosyltransferase family 2 protein [Verrucomicrobiota bacterium]
MNHDNQLAIIVPAFKSEYLARTLESIRKQTNRRFRVYVGDDCSPHSLENLVKLSGLSEAQVVYYRFNENLGGVSLVRQWERCIGLSTEPWIWLFSDDDVMEPDCVEQFYQELERDPASFDLFRFNTLMTNCDDEITDMNPKHPEWEPWNEFAYFLLLDFRRVFQQEFIFRRREYQRIGGFLDLPLAWASDHAFAIACSNRAGVRTIGGSRVRFRQSGDNISSLKSANIERVKWRAFTSYTDWLIAHFEDHPVAEFPNTPALTSLAKNRYYNRLGSSKRWRSVSELRDLATFLGQKFGQSDASIYRLMLRLSLSALRQSVGNTIRSFR